MRTKVLSKLVGAAMIAVGLSAGTAGAQMWICSPSLDVPCTFEAEIEDGTLTIRGKGTGVLPDFNASIVGESDAPWAGYSFFNIIIDENITYIGDNAFAGRSALSSVRSLSVTPPAFGDNIFGFMNIHMTATLFVPDAAESAYREADVWKDFGEINPATAFTVRFDLQGGDGAISPQTVPSGGKAVPPQNSLLNRPGFSFAGWCKDSECADDWSFMSDVVTSDTTLYAKWEPAAPVNVIFASSNDIWPVNIDPQSVPYGGKVTRPTPDPEPLSPSHRFEAWCRNATCANEWDIWDFENDIVKGGMTLYAKWAATTSISPTANGAPRATTPRVSVRGNTLTVSAPTGAASTVNLIDLRGKTVARFRVGESGVASHSLSNIPAGRYFVEFRDGAKRQRVSVMVGVR